MNKSPKRRASSVIPDTSVQIVVGYARQSRARPVDIEAGRVVSTDLQLREIRAFADRHENWAWNEELSRSASDVNVSGGKKQSDRKKGQASWKRRRGLALLLSAAERGEFHHLVVYKLSRLARSAIEMQEIIETFTRFGVTIHVVDMNLSTDNVMGKLLITIISAVAEMELEGIREFAVDAALERAERGLHHGPTPAWIARVLDESAIQPSDPFAPPITKFVLAQPFATTVRRLVRLRCDGYSYSEIARILNQEHRWAAQGGEWYSDLVFLYLRPDYRLRMAGTSIFGTDYEIGDSRRIDNADVFPPLLSPEELEELEAVQATLGSKRSPVDADGNPVDNTGRKQVKTTYLLTGLLYCAVCGKRMASIAASRGNRHYGCTYGRSDPRHTKDLGPDTPESGGYVYTGPYSDETGAQRITRSKGGLSITAASLEDAVVRALGSSLARFGADLIQVARARVAMTPRNGEQALPGTVPKKPARTEAELLIAEDRLMELVEDGDITVAIFRRRMEKIAEERAAWDAYRDYQNDQISTRLAWKKMAGMGRDDVPALSRSELRLQLHRLIERVEAPVTFAGVFPCFASRHPLRWARITLRQPLPGGDLVILSAIHGERFTGPRRVLFGASATPTSETAPAHRAGVKAPGSKSRRGHMPMERRVIPRKEPPYLRDYITQVLTGRPEGMDVPAITKAATLAGWQTELATDHKRCGTVRSVLYTMLGTVERIGRGTWRLKHTSKSSDESQP